MYINSSFSSPFLTQTSSKEKEDNKELKDEAKNQQNPNELSQEEKAQVNKLALIDAKVKAHEMAHLGASGGLASGANFTYTMGPDNKMYAVAGEVSISAQKGSTPEESIAIARQIRAAALAPSDPSPQDYKVAANATKMEFEARAWANRIQAEEDKEKQKEQKAKKEEQNGTQKQAVSAYTQSPTQSNFTVVA